MSYHVCPDCRERVSDNAYACPKCGRRTGRQTKVIFGWVALIVAVVVLAAVLKCAALVR